MVEYPASQEEVTTNGGNLPGSVDRLSTMKGSAGQMSTTRYTGPDVPRRLEVMAKRMILLIATIIVLSAAVFTAAKVSVWATGKPIDMSFLGALIGAAGTIFAATVAYVAVQLQIDAAKEQTIEGQKSVAKFEKIQAEAFLTGISTARDELKRVIDEFGKAGQEPGSYRDYILMVYTAGKLPLNLSANMLPGTFHGQCQAFLQRLNMLAMQTRNLSDRMASPGFLQVKKDWNEIDQYVRDAVADGRKLVLELEADIAAREQNRETK